MDSHKLFVENKFRKISTLVSPNSKILDIGCHDGKLNNFLNNCDYYGIDIDKEAIDKLKKQGIKAKQADLNKQEIPFKNQRFDYVLLLDVLEHVINPKKLLIEAKERLKQGGRLIITLPNDYHLLNKLRFLSNKHLTEDPFAPYGHLHYFPLKSGERFLIQNGFKILKKINLATVKPQMIPQSIKDFLTKLFPQSFARDVLYLLEQK